MKEELIRSVVMDCPLCGKEHEVKVVKIIDQALIKDEQIDYEAILYKCDNCDEEESYFANGKMADENMLAARNSYRTKHNLLLPEQIVKVRKKYNLSQVELSRLLGIGDVTIARYESKSIQDDIYDMLIRRVDSDPYFALSCLKKNKQKFNEEQYSTIKENISNYLMESDEKVSQEKIRIKYYNYNDKVENNGYKVLDINKLERIISYIAEKIKPLYKTKLMKILWYIDMLYYARYDEGLTGLVYLHKDFGALPIGHYQLLELSEVLTEEVEEEDGIKYLIKSNPKFKSSDFDEKEKEIINIICDKFSDFTSLKLSQYMHEEKAYKETKNNEVISYKYARYINI